MIEASSQVDLIFDEIEAKLDMLLLDYETLKEENKQLKQEVVILTDALRDLQFKLDGLNK